MNTKAIYEFSFLSIFFFSGMQIANRQGRLYHTPPELLFNISFGIAWLGIEIVEVHFIMKFLFNLFFIWWILNNSLNFDILSKIIFVSLMLFLSHLNCRFLSLKCVLELLSIFLFIVLFLGFDGNLLIPFLLIYI